MKNNQQGLAGDNTTAAKEIQARAMSGLIARLPMEHYLSLQVAAKIVIDQVPDQCAPTQTYTVEFAGDMLNILRHSLEEILKGSVE